MVANVKVNEHTSSAEKDFFDTLLHGRVTRSDVAHIGITLYTTLHDQTTPVDAGFLVRNY